jgi:hypothetical protein
LNNQEILDNASDGATHVNAIGTTLFRDKADGIRSLSDIKRIAELEAIIRGRDELIDNAVSSRIAELENQVEFEMGQKAIAREQRQRVISRLNSYLIKRANEIGECLPIYLVEHIKEFKGGAK